MRVLVTGGAGFIGHHLVTELLSKNIAVNILDLAEQNGNSVKSLIQLGATYFQGDITDVNSIQTAIKGCDNIVHLAAQTSVQLSMSNPEHNNLVNINGTNNLIEIANQASIKKIIFASSAAVYGDSKKLPLVEQSAGICLSPYAQSKFQCEHDLLERSNSVVYSLRFFNVYGSGQNSESGYSAVIPAFIKSLMNHQKVTIYGDGNQTRDFIHVQDVVCLITQLLRLEEMNESGIYNVASQTELSVNQLYSLISNKLYSIDNKFVLSEPQYSKPREGDILRSYADISKTNAAFGWRPGVNIEKGLESLIKFHLGLKQ